MADYKMVDIDQLETDLTTIADAIRTKSGATEALMFPEGFTEKISNISTGPEEAEITIKTTTANKLLEYWQVVDGALEVVTFAYNEPKVFRKKFGEVFVLLRTKTGYSESAVKATITISGAQYEERFICVSASTGRTGYTVYVITPLEPQVSISIH